MFTPTESFIQAVYDEKLAIEARIAGMEEFLRRTDIHPMYEVKCQDQYDAMREYKAALDERLLLH